MTKQQIIDKISSTPKSKMRSVRVQCRPAEKSSTVLMVSAGKHTWYNERPKYYWSKFDRSFISKGLFSEQKKLFPKIKAPLRIFDKKNRIWDRYELSSFGLLEYFLKNPARYLALMQQRTDEMKYLVKTIKRIKPTLKNPKYFEKNLNIFEELYSLLLVKLGVVYILFDELAWQFRELLLSYLPKHTVNEYFPQFLTAEITKVAMKKGYVLERKNVEYLQSRNICYAMDLTPRLLYVKPKLVHSYANDKKIIAELKKNKITKKDFEKFKAFRMMVPAGFQINEEAQYTETAALGAHFGILLKAISKNRKISIKKLQTMSKQEIIKAVK